MAAMLDRKANLSHCDHFIVMKDCCLEYLGIPLWHFYLKVSVIQDQTKLSPGCTASFKFVDNINLTIFASTCWPKKKTVSFIILLIGNIDLL